MACCECLINVGYYQATFSIKNTSFLITFKIEIWQREDRSSNPKLASMLFFVNDINRIRTSFYLSRQTHKQAIDTVNLDVLEC